MLIGGGGGGAMYAVQIESLETFQQRLTTILQSLEEDNSVMTMNDGTSCFGDFPEGQAFAAAYEQTKQDLINSFNEVTQLVNTMINVVGTNANKYRETEQEITTKFNAILQQYGDTPTVPPPTYSPGSGYGSGSGSGSGYGSGSNTAGTSGTSGTTYYPQNTGSTYATQSPDSAPGPVGGGSPAGTNTSAGAA